MDSSLMAKRYRVHPYRPGVLRAYWGISECGDTPCLTANGLKRDAWILLEAFEKAQPGEVSALKALEEHGFDLTTLQVSIKKKTENT